MLEADLVRAALFPVMIIANILIWRAGRHVPGRMFVLIGTLHLSGIWVGREPLARMAAAGFINQADSGVGELAYRADQELLFWFVLWGLAHILIGQLLIVLEENGVRPPAWLGWELIALNLACGALMPKTGFWWMLLPAWLVLRQSRTLAPRRT